MRALITGATGFAGSHLTEYLLASGDDLAGTTRFAGDWGALPVEAREGIRLIEWDVTVPPSPSASRQFADFAPKYIYHLAGISVPRDCGRQAPTARAIETNVAGTENVLKLAAELPGKPRVMVVSSSHVYASSTAAEGKVRENHPLGPSQPYGVTKLMAESALWQAINQAGIDGFVVRAFNHTGPRQAARLMLPEWASQFVVGTDPIQVLNLESYFDLTDVRDVVQAYRLLMQLGDQDVYNVGSGRAVCSGHLFAELKRLCGFHPAVTQLAPGEQRHPVADISKLGAATGWRPTIPLSKTLSDTVDYWRRRLVDGAEAA